MSTIKLLLGAVIFLVEVCCLSNICIAQVPYKPNIEIANGGQFKDIILPMPIDKKLTNKNIWGTDEVKPRDLNNGVEDNIWCYWGGNPILGDDGKYHIAIARWKEETGHWGWPKSEVAHAVSKEPTGPYKVEGTLLDKAHNPEVIKLNDGTYILHISGGQIYASKRLFGAWELLGKIEIDTRGYKGLSHLYTNLTGLQRKDGSFLFFTKRGDVMISNNGILGPFKIVSVRNYDRYTGYPEDPIIWKSRHQYHVIFNHAVDKKSVYMRSLDGVNWKIEPGVAYDKTVFRYSDGTTNEWCKFERPKVVQDKFGRATHLSLAVMDVEKSEELGNDNHSSKQVVLPLAIERLVEVEPKSDGQSDKAELRIRIKAEADFNPIKQVDVASLRLGSSNSVNYGGGAKATGSSTDNKDLIIVFNADEFEISGNDYDVKLLGKDKAGQLLYAYALLPNYTDDPAVLVCLPIKIEDEEDVQILKTSVENCGLKKSPISELKIFKYANHQREEIKSWQIPVLEPYEKFNVELPVSLDENSVYEAVIVDAQREVELWNKVDDNHYTVVYKGDWMQNKTGKDIYMGSEQVSAQQGAAAIFYFYGTQASCYGHISRQMGSFNVYIDDSFIEKADCYFGADLHDAVIYQTGVLPVGLHKLEIRLTGKHYKGKDKGPVSVDAFSFME